MDIDDWRKEIDGIDERLVELLNARSRCAIEIGRIKRKSGLPVYSPSREAQVIQNVISASTGPLEPDALRRLFERIIDESRRIERVVVDKESEERQRPGSGKRAGAGGRKSKGRP
ncbi:MAG TPA: chorismate mutase [Blastocatellia bacterium]|nr:chorismate mutase [Blastocatellia bacterium]